MSSEFTHYKHGSRIDTDNCGACALENPVMIDGKMGINYSGWPLSYLQNGRSIPVRFYKYLRDELNSENKAYVENLKNKLTFHGYDIEKLTNAKDPTG